MRGAGPMSPRDSEGLEEKQSQSAPVSLYSNIHFRSHSLVPSRTTHCRSSSEPFQQVCSRLAVKNHGLLLYALFSVSE